MDVDQRFFRFRTGILLACVGAVFNFSADLQAGKRELIAEDMISISVPDGWKETDLNADDTLAGYATQDNRSSAFFRDFQAGQGSMTEILDGTIANYEQAFSISDVADYKTGQVKGVGEKKWPAIFTTIEAEVEKGTDTFEMKFYLLVFDVGDHLYLFQASTTRPIREAREKQIFELIQSIIAKG